MQLMRGICHNRYCMLQSSIQATNQQMAEIVSKYRHTDSLKKILGKQDECKMTCVKCYKLFTMG